MLTKKRVVRQIEAISWMPGQHKHALFLLLSLFVFLLASTPSAFATEIDDSRLQLRGFATLGLVNSGDESLGFRRDISREGHFDGEWTFEPDSILGLQLDAKLSDSLDGAVQLVAKDRPEHNFESNLEWAFLRYRYNSNLVFRGGRMGTDLFMLSEYRNVGFAYLWARPPIDFYGALALDSYDGIDISYSHPLSDGLLQLKLFAGQSDQAFRSSISDIEIKLNPIIGANLIWESENWRSRIVYQQSTYDSSIDSISSLVSGLSSIPSAVWPAAADLADQLETQDKVMRYYALGIAFDRSPWVSQAELGFIDSGSEATFPDLLTAYLSAGRSFDAITVYATISAARNTKDTLEVPSEPSGGTNPMLVALEQGIRLVADQTGIDQQSLSLGMRWDIRHNLALKLQWDRTWVEAFGSALWDQASPVDQDHTVDSYSINLNFIF